MAVLDTVLDVLSPHNAIRNCLCMLAFIRANGRRLVLPGSGVSECQLNPALPRAAPLALC